MATAWSLVALKQKMRPSRKKFRLGRGSIIDRRSVRKKTR